MKKTVSWILLALLMLSMLLLAFNIQPAKANGPIYIRTDGSVDPPTAPIQQNRNIYTLTDNIFVEYLKDGIVVQKDNIVVDGAGYTVQGTEKKGTGIDLTGRSNVTIKNVEIKAFEYGIRFHVSLDHNKIYTNNITANKFGILLRHSLNNSISGNDITANDWSGIWFYNSSNNGISGNDITANKEYGIFLGVSSNNTISGNNITANDWRGLYLQRFSNYNAISENNITHNNYGIHLVDSSNNTISGNNITANNMDGIYLDSSLNNSISVNDITANKEYGIRLHDSSNNSIYHNNFVNNFHQIYDTSWNNPEIPHSINTWDDGYPSGGNYWSDYTGEDANYDGIGDTLYVIDENNVDHHPLMAPIIIPEFPPAMILLIFMVLTTLTVTFIKRKIPRKPKD